MSILGLQKELGKGASGIGSFCCEGDSTFQRRGSLNMEVQILHGPKEEKRLLQYHSAQLPKNVFFHLCPKVSLSLFPDYLLNSILLILLLLLSVELPSSLGGDGKL